MKGYTLLQLILVISLISILAGFFAFRFSGVVDQVKLSSSAKVIAADLRAAQMRAQANKEEVVIIFYRNFYSLNGKERKLPSPVEVQNPQTIKFSKNGTPLPGYFGTLKLISRGKTLSLIISPIGRVRIE